jgi:hypothetical protein
VIDADPTQVFRPARVSMIRKPTGTEMLVRSNFQYFARIENM